MAAAAILNFKNVKSLDWMNIFPPNLVANVSAIWKKLQVPYPDNITNNQKIVFSRHILYLLSDEYNFLSCCACSGTLIAVKTEADSNDIAEHPHDDNLRPYLCTVCDKRYRTKDQLSRHWNIHTGKYKCTECGLCAQGTAALKIHSRIHSGEKPYECRVCSRRFTAARTLVKHSRTHSAEKPFKCHMCDKAFSQSESLNSHMRIHTGEKPYKCHLCDKAFSQSPHLNSHMRVHMGEKPYKCHVCDKEFSESAHRNNHMRVHTGDNP